MATRRKKLPLFGKGDRDSDFRYVYRLIRVLQDKKDRAGTYTSSSGVEKEGYLLESYEFEWVLFVLHRVMDFVDSAPPGPKSYRTWWDAYCGEPKYREYLKEEENYVNTHGTERGKAAFAIRAVAGNDRYKQDNLRKQIERWSKLPLHEKPPFEK